MGVTFCLLTQLAAAQPPPSEHRVTFHTRPEGAVVKLGPRTLGLSGTPLAVPLTGQDERTLEFSFSLPGYAVEPFAIQESRLKLARELPLGAGGKPAPATLKPASLAAHLAALRAPLAFATVILIGAGGMVLFHTRSHRRARRLEDLLARTDGGGLLEGSELGGYYLLGELGAGGMARVYRGRKGSEEVAVKVLQATLSGDPELFKRFKREVRLCKEMDHPHIVRLYDWGEEHGLVYLVMELVEGGTLRERLRGEGLSPEQAAEVLLPLFQALAYAHSRGVVHRDLKPENVMFTASGKLKVMDFGLSRADNSTNLTQTGTVLGTPAYMAPEQIQGVSYDRAIDQYALGVMAYELLTGRQPFQAPDPLQVLFQHVGEKPEPPSRLRADLPAEVEQILLRMLAKAPESRFASVEEAGAHLVAALGRWGG